MIKGRDKLFENAPHTEAKTRKYVGRKRDPISYYSTYKDPKDHSKENFISKA